MKTTDPADLLITEALTELRCARAEFEHCPSADNEITVEYAELRLNRLLDRRRTAGKREAVKSR